MEYGWDVEGPLLAKRWEIDCVDITLTQNDTPNNPHTYRGKGFLRQNADGAVGFRLYPADEKRSERTSAVFSPNEAGKLYPGDHYYSLAATDWYERVWKCRRVNPDVSSTTSGGQHVRVVDGIAYDLQAEKESRFGENIYLLKIVWNADVEIPATTGTDIITLLGNEEAGRSGSMNAAVFKSEFGLFKIWTEPSRLYLTCEADNPTHPHHANFFVRVTEAISFVLGRRLNWNFIEEHRGGREITRLYGQGKSDKLALPQPVGLRWQHYPGYSWQLFLAYLRFIAMHDGDKRPSSSRHLFSVMQAHQGTINGQALALSVAVEGMCKSLFPPSPADKAETEGWVQSLQKHCAAWPEFKKPEVRAALFNRMHGLIGSMTNIRPIDIMMRLVADGVIPERLARAWKKLRDPSAHAKEEVAGSTQELVDLCGAVTVLLYQLIFKKIGYEGAYTDYSEYGYRPKYYRCRPVTEEEIAVAAYFHWQAEGKKHGNDLAHWFKAWEMLESGLI